MMSSEPALRVLYAEDSPVSAEIVSQTLSCVPPGMAVTIASTYAAAREHLLNGTFDVLLADYYLPDGDGLALLELVRQLALPIAVVLVTSIGNEALAVSALKAGVDDYIARNNDYTARLPAVLQGAYHRFQSRQVARARPIYALYVEPNTHDSELLRTHLLRYAPHLVLDIVHDGATCLERLQTEQFDVILTDYELADTNGLDLLKEINERGFGLPVVLVTGRGNEELAVAALWLGAADYLVKHEGYLIRLTPTIENVVAHFRLEHERVERQQAEKRLGESQAQLIHAEKLAALGQLISGVAHELNNPLAGIIGYAQLLREYGLPQAAMADVVRIEAQAHRARRIISNLLTFARRYPAEHTWVNLNELVERALALRAYDLRERMVDVTATLAPNLPLTMANPDQIQQAILNLLLNAEQALSGTYEDVQDTRFAQLTITTQHLAGATNEISICVTDNGPGIAPELQRRIFEPFFTTRPVGTGIGLGLAVVHGIVQNHAGRIWVESQPGVGTTIQVTLPLINQIAPAHPRIQNKTALSRPQVLIIDNETTVIRLVQQALHHHDMDVDIVDSGRAALERLQQHLYNVVICDVQLPDLPSQHLFAYLEQMQPQLTQRLLLIIDDTTNADTVHFIQQTGCRTITKPFELSDIIALVKQAVAQAP